MGSFSLSWFRERTDKLIEEPSSLTVTFREDVTGCRCQSCLGWVGATGLPGLSKSKLSAEGLEGAAGGCHGAVPPRTYLVTCERQVCGEGGDPCPGFQGYAAACQAAGGALREWREATGCREYMEGLGILGGSGI